LSLNFNYNFIWNTLPENYPFLTPLFLTAQLLYPNALCSYKEKGAFKGVVVYQIPKIKVIKNQTSKPKLAIFLLKTYAKIY
jgi:hypothetical protein